MKKLLVIAAAVSCGLGSAAQAAEDPTHRYFACAGGDQTDKFFVGLQIGFDGQSLNGFGLEASARKFGSGSSYMQSESVGKNLTEVRVSRVDSSGIAHLMEIGFVERANGAIIFRGLLTKFQAKPGTTKITIQTNEISEDRKISTDQLNCAQVYSEESYKIIRSGLINSGAKVAG